MKKVVFALGIFLEICFMGFYLIKYLSLRWGVEKLYLGEPRVFTMTFIVLAIALIIQMVSVILIFRKDVPYKYVFIFSVIFNLSLLFVWNIGSNDLYTHIQRGRMVAKYGASPYTVTYDSLSYDLFYKETRTVWSGQLSIYGPVFTDFGAIVSYLAKDSLIANILIFKLIYSVLNILVGYFIYKITKSSLASLLYSWSPLVIFEIQANNHLEILSIFPIVLSLYLLISKTSWKRYVLALSILTLGSLTKFFGFVVYPFYLLFAFKKLSTVREKLLFLFIGGFVQILIVGFSFLPYLDNVGILNGFFDLAGGKFISPSLVILLTYNTLPLFHLNKDIAQTAVQLIYKIYYVFLGVKSTFSRFTDNVVFVKILVLVFAGFTLIYLNLILPWYTLTLFALLAIYYGLSKEKKYITFVYLLTVYSFLLYLRTV
ncbi:MAG TPA: hypothetical protein VLE44_01925 [Candidatus Saccharimonadales bacterium]|nr:hypothetical protein [Candidatus Saccharimonadales bacterium]